MANRKAARTGEIVAKKKKKLQDDANKMLPAICKEECK